MDFKTIVKQTKVDGGRIRTDYSDGSIEFSIPNPHTQAQKLTVEDELKKAGNRMFGTVDGDKGTGVLVPSDFGKAVNKNLDELDRVKKELEQYRLNEASKEYAKGRTGGGKVSLNEPRQKRQFNSPIEMINDLYDRHEAGDKNASRNLDALWELSREPILEMERRGFSMSACIQCGNAIIQGEGKVCKVCGFDYTARDREGFTLFQ